MYSFKSVLVFLFSIVILTSCSKNNTKSLNQLQKEFADWRFGMFLCFDIATYTDDEGWENNYDTTAQIFNPQKLDCSQWAKAAKSAGMTFAVLTTKHHYGFSLWPTKFGKYGVTHSPYKEDVVRQYIDAFREEGITPCLYYSIWDRRNGIGNPDLEWRDENEPHKFTESNIEFIKGQLTELLTNYGEIPLLLIDGWSWQMGQHSVPYAEIRAHVKSLQPNCLIIDHNGLSEQWGGDAIYFEEPKSIWAPDDNTYPSVQGMTLTNGWFWHPDSPYELSMTVDDVVEDHLKVLEKRYTNFLLNCSVNPDGLLDDAVVERLAEIGERWTPDNTRPPLPNQPRQLQNPFHPVSAKASSGNALNAIDAINDINGEGQAYQTLWETVPGDSIQAITIDLGKRYSGIEMLRYLPRQDNDSGVFNTLGTIEEYAIFYSEDGINFNEATTGKWTINKKAKQAEFNPVSGRYIKLQNRNNTSITVVNEIMVGK